MLDKKNAEPLVVLKINAPVSIIIPTYQEVENIPHMLARLDALRQRHALDLEVLFMDDDSGDGSVEAVTNSGFDWARMIVRAKDRGLSQAVIEGFQTARHPVLICMDCDLSHPPEIIPQLILGLETGQEMMIGSRYVPGASTDDDWGIFRWLNSVLATLMARPLTSVRDPMSGFFAMRRSDFETAEHLNPVGYKIALELIVKCGFENVGETPIHFQDRRYGESKLNLKEQLKYIKHLRRLYLHRFANAMHLAQFLVVGASGVLVNLTVLSLLQLAGFANSICLAGGIGTSVLTNFMLNRRFTFSYARDRKIGKQFVGFVIASGIGALINFGVSYMVSQAAFLSETTYKLQLAALFGIAAGMTFNYLGNRFIVFRKTHIRS